MFINRKEWRYLMATVTELKDAVDALVVQVDRVVALEVAAVVVAAQATKDQPIVDQLVADVKVKTDALAQVV